MLIRLLLTVLMLAGPLPARVCTCQAAGPQSPAGGVSGEAAPSKKSCRCSHHRLSSEQDIDHAEKGDQCDVCSVSGRSGEHEPHQQDCPVLNPRPVPQALQSPAPDVPVDAGVALPVIAEPSRSETAASRVRHRHRPLPSAVPLYLSLLSIRI